MAVTFLALMVLVGVKGDYEYYEEEYELDRDSGNFPPKKDASILVLNMQTFKALILVEESIPLLLSLPLWLG